MPLPPYMFPDEHVVTGYYVHDDGEITSLDVAVEKGKGYCTFTLDGDETIKFGWIGVDFYPSTLPNAEEESLRAAHARAHAHAIKARAIMNKIEARLSAITEEKQKEEDHHDG